MSYIPRNIMPTWARQISLSELAVGAERQLSYLDHEGHCVAGWSDTGIRIHVLAEVDARTLDSVASVISYYAPAKLEMSCRLPRDPVAPAVRAAFNALVTNQKAAEACGTCGTRAVLARRCGFCGARA